MNKCTREEEIFNGVRFNVKRKIYETPDKKEYIRECIETSSAAVILPITDNNEVIFVKQYREVIGEETLELPAGIIENGESSLETARRELEEETGFYSALMTPMINYYVSCGYTNEKIYIFLAKDLKPGKINYDIDEQIHEIVRIPIEKCYKLQKENYFKHANTNVALLMYKDISRD